MTLRGRLATYLTVFAVLVLVIVYDRYSRMAGARATEERVERDSFAILDAASTAEERTEAVGHLGIVLPTQDGGWVAIRYLHSHGSGWSSAVARDSGGGWFISREHYCGRFKTHRLLKDQNDADRCEPVIREIEQAPSLEEARVRLVALGFRRVDPPVR